MSDAKKEGPIFFSATRCAASNGIALVRWFRALPRNPAELFLLLQDGGMKRDEDMFGQIEDAAEIEWEVMFSGHTSQFEQSNRNFRQTLKIGSQFAGLRLKFGAVKGHRNRVASAEPLLERGPAVLQDPHCFI